MAEILDSPGSVAAVLSIDFSKAFNRMQHRACLRSLEMMGASERMRAIVASFLSNRKMRVKTSQGFSSVRPMLGGAPQGTKSGNFLFAATINCIEDTATHDLDESEVFGSELGLTDLAVRVLGSNLEQSPTEPETSFAAACARMPRSARRAALDSTYIPEEWNGHCIRRALDIDEPNPPWVAKYVDDFSCVEGLDTKAATRHITTGREKRTIHATGLEHMYKVVKTNADAIGMTIHPEKTQLLCVSSTINSEVGAYINVDGRRIESSAPMKLLGVEFESRYGFEHYTSQLRRKFAAKNWALSHLKSAGIGRKDLVAGYKSYVRPVLEYADPSFSTVITGEQSERIERCQRVAMRTIYGGKRSYASALEESGLERLDDRRAELTEKFAVKTYLNPRFSGQWFPAKPETPHWTRKTEKIQIEKANCTRKQRAPVHAMRKILNDKCDLPDREE